MLAAVAGVAMLMAAGGMAPVPAAGDSHLAPPPGAVPGMMVVSDDYRSQVFYPDGTFAFTLNPQELAGVGAANMDFGPDGRIVVGTDHDVRVYSPDHTYDFRVGYPAGHGALGQVAGGPLAVGPDGQVAVVDAHRVQVFNPDGSFAFAFGLRVEGSGGYRYDIDFNPDGQIVVADRGNKRVQVFHPNGTAALSLDVVSSNHGGSWEGPHRVAVGPDGVIVAATYSTPSSIEASQ